MSKLVLAALICTAPLAACDRAEEHAKAASTANVGGPFQLVDQDGKAVTEKDLLGKPTAIFFGFTFCPEVCPTTLTEMTGWLKDLGPDADKLNVVFVSVDPERDTPAQLKLYLSNFDHRIRGLTGTTAQTDAAAKAYRIYHRKVAIEGGEYTVDHSSAVYLFDAKGAFVEPIGYGGPPERGLAQLKALLKG
ncbi:SCO family protein [Caulobacter sp. 602-2]|uniref:SCO family protein n=1 Tax=Caulobacter sp. 602-2 TaxID=2710887 RepID=A0A6G4QU41_9CAUL|nr:SCO family protein [Caulobacter sp. 602-2]NGM49140.1 SCO family protein [Caulobacter sp. 602-2]